jgi:hypothetical protein
MQGYDNQCNALNMSMEVYGIGVLVRDPGAIMSALLILRNIVNYLLQFGNTGAAVGSGLQLLAYLIGGGEAFSGDGCKKGFFTDIKAGADDFACVLLLDRGPACQNAGALLLTELIFLEQRDQPFTRRQAAVRANEEIAFQFFTAEAGCTIVSLRGVKVLDPVCTFIPAAQQRGRSAQSSGCSSPAIS